MTQGLLALHARRPADARAHVTRAIGLAPALGDAPAAALLAAFARSGDADLREVGRRLAKRLLSVDPDHPRTLLDLAVLHLQAGERKEARQLLEQAIIGNRSTPEISRVVKELLHAEGVS